MFKKSFSMLLTISLLLCNIVVKVGAEDINMMSQNYSAYGEDYTQSTIIISNEYEALKQRLSQEKQEVSNYVLEEYRKHIYSLKEKYSEEQLRDFGYDQNQINAILYYDGSEEMTRAASATISAAPSKIILSYNASSNQTTAKMHVQFTVNGILSWYFKNYAGLTLSSSNGNPFQAITSSNAYGQIMYKVYDASGNFTNSYSYLNATKVGDQGVNGAYGFSFSTRPEATKMIYTATFSIQSIVEGKPNWVTFRFAYGFASLSLSTSFGLTFNGSSTSAGVTIQPRSNITLYPTSSDSRVATYYLN